MTAGSLRRRWLKAGPIAIVLAFVALLAWGFSSPVGSSPDDDFHLPSIWCGVGDRAGLCEPGSTAAERSVPPDLFIDSVCYAHEPAESARCQGSDFGTGDDDLLSTPRGNFAHLYPPVYYFTMGLFAGPNVEVSVLLMRAVNVLLFLGVVTVLYLLLPERRRPTLIWGLVITAVPLGMFLIPSTNPSGWAYLSAGTVWIALLGYFESEGRRKIGLGIVAAAATVIGAGARADAGAFAAVAIVLVLVLTARRTRQFALAAILPAALLVVAAIFYFSSSQSAASSTGLSETTPPTLENIKSLIMANFMQIPDLWVGVFGRWGLGWLDTAMPAAVWFAAFGAFAAVIAGAVRSLTWRKGIALVLAFGVAWAFPMVLLIQTQAYVGAYVQPRYIYPLIVIFAGIALLQVTRSGLTLSRVQIGLLIGALSLANAVALHTNMRRYITGNDSFGPNLNSSVEWWWNIPVSPMVVWVLGSAAFVGMLIALLAAPWRRAGAVREIDSVPVA